MERFELNIIRQKTKLNFDRIKIDDKYKNQEN